MRLLLSWLLLFPCHGISSLSRDDGGIEKREMPLQMSYPNVVDKDVVETAIVEDSSSETIHFNQDRASLRSESVTRKMASNLDCSLYSTKYVASSRIKIRHVYNQIDNTVTVEMTWNGSPAYVAFTVASYNGDMVPNSAVIGLPLDGTVLKYWMANYRNSGTYAMSSSYQTLSNTYIFQNSTQTIMRFTQSLSDSLYSGETQISSSGSNIALYAIGDSNYLGMHQVYSSYTMRLTPCIALNSSSTTTSTTSSGSTTSATTTIGSATTTAGSATTTAGSATTTAGSATSATTTATTTTATTTATQTKATTTTASTKSQGTAATTNKTQTVVGKNSTVNSTASSYDCSLYSSQSVSGGRIVIRNVYNPRNNSVTMEMVWIGSPAYVSVSIASNGYMVPNMAVMGLPGDNSVQKYWMKNYKTSGTTLMSSQYQTLKDTSIKQNSTHTIMRFTQKLDDPLYPGETQISATGENKVLFAIGISNDFGMHQIGASFRLTLTPCRQGSSSGTSVSAISTGSASEVQLDTETGSIDEKAFRTHGLLMALGWGLFIPAAIGASLVRSIVPGPPDTWFKLHKYLNLAGIICITFGFFIAITKNGMEGLKDFNLHNHQSYGYLIVFFAWAQMAGGFLRPRSHSTVQPVESMHPHDAEASSVPADGTKVAAKDQEDGWKRMIVPIWKQSHRWMGLLLIGLAWYTAYTGIQLLSDDYPQSVGMNLGKFFWSIASITVATIVALIIYAVFFPKTTKTSLRDSLRGYSPFSS